MHVASKKIIFIQIEGPKPWVSIKSLHKKTFENEDQLRQHYEEQVTQGGRHWLMPFCGAFQLDNVKYEEIPDKVVFIDLQSNQENWCKGELLAEHYRLGEMHRTIITGFDNYFMCAKSI